MPRSDQFLTTGSIVPESQLPATGESEQNIAAQYIRERTQGAPTLRVAPAPTPQGFTVPGTPTGALGVKPDLTRMVAESLPAPAQVGLGLSQGLFGVAKTILTTAAKINPLTRTVAGVARAIPQVREGVQQIAESPLGQSAQTFNELMESPAYTHYQGAGQIIGESAPYFATGQFAAPIGTAVSTRLATAAPRIASSALGRTAINLLGSATGEIATSVPITAAMSGGDIREIGIDTAASAAIPVAGRALGSITKPVLSWIGDLTKSTNIRVPQILGLPAPQKYDQLPTGVREALESGSYAPGSTVYVNSAGDVVSPATVPPPEIERAMRQYFWTLDTLRGRKSTDLTSETIQGLVREANELARQIDTWNSSASQGAKAAPPAAPIAPARAQAPKADLPPIKLKTQELLEGRLSRATPETADDVIRAFHEGHTDDLTGAMNKRSYTVNGLENRPHIIVDNDFFKQVNDTFGHKAGDNVLRHTAEVFQDLFGNDRVYRYGGEEFIIDPADMDYDTVARKLEEARQRFASFEITGKGKSRTGYNFSSGFGENMQEADRRLYQAKGEMGRGIDNINKEWYNDAYGKQTIEPTTARAADQGVPADGGRLPGAGEERTAQRASTREAEVVESVPSRAPGSARGGAQGTLESSIEASTERLSPSQIREVLTRGDKKPARAKITEIVDTVKDEYLDRFDVFRQISDDAAKAGVPLAPGSDANKLVSRVTSAASIADQYVDDNLRPILENVGDQNAVDNLDVLMVAQRAEELAKNGKGKGADLEALRSEIGSAEYDRLSGIAKDIRKYAHGLLEQLKGAGIISPEDYKAIKASNEFYTPFFKVVSDAMDTTLVGTKRGLNVSNNTLDRIKEGLVEDAAIKNPLARLLAQTYNITRAVESNRVMKALADTGNFIKHETAPTGKPYITLMDNGKKVYYEVDKRVADAVSGLTVEDLNVAVKLLAAPARLLRVGATTLNVGFAVPNAIRDQYSAMVKAKYGFNPINFIQGIASAFKRDSLFKEWARNGGDQSGMFAQDMARLNRNVDQLTGNESNWVKAGRIVSSPLELVRALGDFTEKGTRLGVFKRAMEGAKKEGLQKGWSDFDIITEAIHQSRNASVDFARAGSKMRAVNALIPFLNARLQGSVGLIRAFQDNPKQATAIGTAIATVPAIALYMHNRNYPEYDEVPQYIKDQYFVMMTGNDTVPFIKIPKGEVGRLFANPAESFLDFAYNKGDKTFSDLAVDMLSAISPVSGINDVMPTSLKVPYELMANYDTFRGRNIVSPYQKDLPPEMQFNERTSETAKILGRLTNTSPAKIEHAILGFTAGVGGQTLQLTDLMLGKTPKVGELPIMSRLLGKETDLSVSATKIYEEADKEKQATMMDNSLKKNAIKKALATGDSASLINTIDSIEPSKRKTMINDVLKDMREATLKPKLKAISKIESTKVRAKVISNELDKMDSSEAKQFIDELTKGKILDKNTLKELNIQRNVSK